MLEPTDPRVEQVRYVDPSPIRPWCNQTHPLAGARNAHFTNTREEMQAALARATDWLEGDIRMSLDAPQHLEMRHDLGPSPGALSLSEWLRIGGASGRGLKLDIKEVDRTPLVLDEVERSGVPDERLMFNLTCEGIETYGPEIRRRFPEAMLAINPPAGGPTLENARRMAALADRLGGLSTFVLREDLVTEELVRLLLPHGTISVWSRPTPGSPEQREARLRAIGVNGMVDLR